MKKNVKHSVLWALTTTLLLGSVITACTPASSEPNDTSQEITGQVEVTTNDPQDTSDVTVGTQDTTDIEADTTEDTQPSAPDSVIDALSPAYGETVVVASAQVAEYASKYTIGSSAKYHSSGDIYIPLPITLTWEDVGADCYRVRMATDETFSDSQVVLTAGTSASFTNPLVATTYYWQVEALYQDKTDVSAIFSFQTANTPRTVYIDGVTNSRDIGGYATGEGTRLRQGMVYRSSYLVNITEEGIYQAREELGIRCELDVRTPGEGGAGKKSPLGDDIIYHNIDGIYYEGIKDSKRQATLAQEIKVFADPNNYPMLIHCSYGRDRTGTLAMIIMALCGVSEEDILMDYELSFFCEFCCNESTSIHVDGNMRPTIKYIKSFGRTRDSLQYCAEKYCLSIGVTQEEIDSIRSILVEEVK